MKKYAPLALLILVALIVGSYFVFRTPSEGIPQKQLVVESGNLEVNINSTGVVQPENRLDIKAPIAGRVEKIFVKEGYKIQRGQRLALVSSTERAALIDAAKSQSAEEIKHWEELYRPTPILAPISGTLILRNVEGGQSFTSADALFTMSDRLTIKAQVDETDIAQIKIGQKASVVLDAYPNEKIEGLVDQIAFDAKTVNNVTTYVVDVLPSSENPLMRSGMTANVKFFIQSKTDVLTVPNEALKLKDGKYFVRVLGDKGEQDAEVKVGVTDLKKTEITEGLVIGQVFFVPDFEKLMQQNQNAKKSSNPFMPGGSKKGNGSKKGMNPH
jgi:macrolide-specific efflux system membrane fusion protein